jgi:hypothetical protein
MISEQHRIRGSLFLCATFLIVTVLPPRGVLASFESDRGDCDCQKISSGQGAVHIKYEETQMLKKKEGKSKVTYLRIKNNTTCELLLLSTGNYFRLIDNIWTSAVEDGEEVNVYYEIETKESRFKHYRASRLMVVRLLPGRSCVFPVQSCYLKKANIICVPCRYAWEDSSVVGSSPRSEALFHASDLPRGWDN